MTAIETFKSTFRKDFDIKDLGKVDYILGIQLVENEKDNCFYLLQSNAIKDLLKKYGLENCNPVDTPTETDFYTKILDENGVIKDNTAYREIIGSLLYISSVSRPDISFTVNILSRFVENPYECHFKALKRILRYLKGTIDYGIKVNPTDENISVYVDADWAGDKSTRKSTSGFLIKYGGVPIIWKSTKQQSTALSTVESEFQAIAQCVQDVLWFTDLLESIQIRVELPVLIYNDNQGAIQVAHNESQSPKLKHIAIKTAFVKDNVANKIIRFEYLPTNEMQADILTKGLSSFRFKELRKLMNIIDKSV